MIEYFHPGFYDNSGPANNLQPIEHYYPDNTPITGYLVSRAFKHIYKNKWNNDFKKAREYYDSCKLKLFGDCGAFSYVDEVVPPISVEDVIDFYNEIDVDYGASLDHVVPDYDAGYDYFFSGIPTPQDYQRRLEITLENGSKFLKECKSQGVRFLPIGSAQGWSPNSYVESITQLKKMGYKKIAIGGIAKLPKPRLKELLSTIKEVIGDTEIHLFGITQPKVIKNANLPNITSVDGMGPFINSVISAVYFHDRGKALCVPLKDVNLADDFVRLLKDKRYLEIENTLLDPETSFKIKGVYKTLKLSNTWDPCSCNICKVHGNKMLIYHNNFSRLRGFHNMYMVRKQLDLI
jgi:hypothetical protein